MLPRFFLFACLGLSLLAFSCGSDDCVGSERTVRELIADSMLQVQQLPDDGGFDRGLRYVIATEGSAEKPTLEDSVTFTYVALTTEGDTVAQSPSQPETKVLNGLITGWQLGLPLIGRGGRIRLYLPSALAYGANPVANLCASSDLIFDIELIDF
jgi:FKBP-type peptidyl-prolyl cis-trans isomerase